MTAEQAKLQFALEQARKGFDLLATAYDAFEEIGIDPVHLQYQTFMKDKNSVLLSKGIANLSLLSGIEIESDKPYAGYGRIITNGIQFHQDKLPIKEDRYA